MLKNVKESTDLGGLATRKSREDEYKSVRNPLVAEEVQRGWEVEKENKATTRLRKRKSDDRLLEDRVWTLLYRMGFIHLSDHGGAHVLLNDKDPESPHNQIDVVAIDDDVALAIECKSSNSPKKLQTFSADLAKHVALRDRFTRAVADQFPQKHKRPSMFAFWTEGIIITENDKKRAQEARVSLFDETDMKYYEQLVSQIGHAARFQFLADVLKGRAVPGLEIRVPAIRTKMGGAWSYAFSVSPEYLLKIAFVSHRARGKASDIDAYQRLLKKSRLKSIRQYISDDGFFPTNIVVNIAQRQWLTFDRGKQESEDNTSQALFGWLTIRPAFKVAWIIDGQHRLYAYAEHPLARKSLISVMAFVGLEASEQARLFIDINAEQRKVKQSLLQELFAELHWNAAEPEERIRAILSKAVQALDSDLGSPFKERILKADDAKTETRCISLTSVFKALERGSLFIVRMRQGEVQEYGPLWAGSNENSLRRTVTVISAYFDFIKQEAPDLWNRGAGDGGGLSMNDGVTVCINVFRSILSHLEKDRLKLADLDDNEVVESLEPFARSVGVYFRSLSEEQMRQFRALRGVQGQTTGTRRVEEALSKVHPHFHPPGLSEYLSRARAETTKYAFDEVTAIEASLQRYIVGELKAEFPNEQDWWFNGVPKNVRKKVDDRINEEGGKKGGREENFDLIDYREIALANWTLFEKALSSGKSGAKDVRTKWIHEVNELRKPVMHASKGQSLPISEEQLNRLREIRVWMQRRVSGEVDDQVAA